MGRKYVQGGEGTMSGGGAMEQTSRHVGTHARTHTRTGKQPSYQPLWCLIRCSLWSILSPFCLRSQRLGRLEVRE